MFAKHAFRRTTASLFLRPRHFSTTSTAMARLRIGFVPEHFSTPIAFAQKHYDLDAELIPFPTGTGALAGALKSPPSENGSIDVAIGLTEGFVADLGKAKAAGQPSHYGLIGTYVESPLCWAISTGAARDDISSVADLKGKRVGVSRIGSGSYVMSFVLADQRGWLSQGTEPFEVKPTGDFKALRKSVGADKTSDFFMWEHFTTKHFWDNGELKRIGEIYTPWPSWIITARTPKTQDEVGAYDGMLSKLNQGVQHYRENKDEAVEYITSTMEYSKDDAIEWMTTVRFAEDVRGLAPSMIDQTAATLRKAGVLDEKGGGSEHMVHIKRREVDPVSNPADVA